MDIAKEREIMRQLLLSAFQTHNIFTDLSVERQKSIIKHIETSCQEQAIELANEFGTRKTFKNDVFRNIYSITCYKVLANIKLGVFNNSSYLVERIISGDFNDYTIAFLTSETLMPEASIQERTFINLQKNQIIKKKVSTFYVCSKCKGNETYIEEYTGRSADEASIFSIKCARCEHKWRR